MTEPVNVTEADRELYAAYLATQPGVDASAPLFAAIRAGEEDASHGVQIAAFARIAVEEAARLAERERAARVIEDHPDEVIYFYDRPGSHPGNQVRPVTRADLAAAIRSGDDQ